MYVHGRARVSPSNPRSFAICDRCSFLYNIDDLRWQYDYAGTTIQNLRVLVCRTCYDKPNPQLSARVLPPDPLPTLNARPENFSIDDNNFLVTQAGALLMSQGGANLVIETNG